MNFSCFINKSIVYFNKNEFTGLIGLLVETIIIFLQ